MSEYEGKYEHYFPRALVRFKQMDYQAVTSPVAVVLKGPDQEVLALVAEKIKSYMYTMDDILKWIHSRELPALPVGNSHLVPKHILIEYMAGEAYRNRIPKSKKQYEDIGGYWVWEQEKSSSLQTKKEA